MAVFRGLQGKPIAFASAEQIKATGRYSETNDASTLTGEQTYSFMHQKVVDKTLGGLCVLRGDYLIYGWRPWLAPMTLIIMFSLGALATGLILKLSPAPSDLWILTWSGIAFSALLFAISYLWYPRSRFSHYIVFDRRNRLIHLPRWFSHKQDSIRWEEADLCILDMPTGYFFEHITTELHLVPPPLTLQHQGTRHWWRFFKYHFDSKEPKVLKNFNGVTYDGAEAVFRFIVDFMTRQPEQSIAMDAMCLYDMGIEIKELGNNDFQRAVRKSQKLWSLIDPERLPTEPNWVRDEQSAWQQLRPAVRARFGWFGLWNKSYTLPPHLRGTKADPACKNDSEAPLPVARWFAVADGGTGELVGQPVEVLASVLRGEGMPSKASLHQTRLKEGGWPGPERDWWYEQFAEKKPANITQDEKVS